MPSINSSRVIKKTRQNRTRRVKSANSSPHSRQLAKRSSLRYIRENYPRTPTRRYTRSIIL